MSCSVRSSPDGTERLRVLVVDPEEIVVCGFKSLLLQEPWVEEVVGARDATEALRMAPELRPQVILADVDCIDPASSFAECIRIESGSTCLLLTADHRVPATYARALGAVGVISKTWRAEAIAAMIRTAGLGMKVFEDDVEGASLLTDREASILMFFASGATNRETAARVQLSPHTIKDHVRSLYRKLGVRNRAEAIVRARELGLLGPDRRDELSRA